MAGKNSNRKAKSLDDDQKVFKKIGNRLKQLRIEAGYTAAEKFANDHDLHRAQYARYEAGMDMKLSSLLKIARAHNMTIEELFEDFD